MTGEEIIEMYEGGLLTLRGTLERIAALAAADDIDRILSSLPLVWRKDVELYIFDMYDNDADSDDFISIGDPEPDLDLRRKRIAALRAWIALRRTGMHKE
jgi:hypothetical protein